MTHAPSTASAARRDYPGFKDWRREATARLHLPVGVHLDMCVGKSNWAHNIPSGLMIGVDLDRERLTDHQGRYFPLYMDVRQLPKHFFEKTVDLVTFFDAIEHLPKEDALALLQELDRITRQQIMLFIPVEDWGKEQERERLAKWRDGLYGIHLSTWHPDEMADLGYEVLYNPTYHKRPDRTFGAMFCWKNLDSKMRPMTFAEFKQLEETMPYYKDRWEYLHAAIELIEGRPLTTALELGAHVRPLVSGSDVMDISLDASGVDYIHDATATPWPLEDKQYDLFVALQVWEHLSNKQAEAFAEVRRIARTALLSFPLNWNCPDDPIHHGITEERIADWTHHLEPVAKRKVGSRILYLFELDVNPPPSASRLSPTPGRSAREAPSSDASATPVESHSPLARRGSVTPEDAVPGAASAQSDSASRTAHISEVAPCEAYVIAGVHRSGSSLISRIVNLLGLNVGPDDDLLGSSPSNPTGHWEIRTVVRLNDDVLRRLGGSWQEPPFPRPGWENASEFNSLRSYAARLIEELFPNTGRIGWKDPRMSILMPFWETVIPIDGCVIPIRNPAEVAASLAARNGLPLEQGAELWLKYLVHAWCHANRRIVIRYEDCFSDLDGVLDKLAGFMNLPLPDDAARASARDFLNPELHHHVGETLQGGERMQLAMAVFELLQATSEEAIDSILHSLHRRWLAEDELERTDRESEQLRLRVLGMRRELEAQRSSIGTKEAHALYPQARDASMDRPDSRARSWLKALGEGRGIQEKGPEFVRLADGKVYALEAETRRRVATALLWRALEPVFGAPKRAREADLAKLPEGPPVDFVRGPSGPPVVLLGGKAYPVHGLPTPMVADRADLAAFPTADVVLDFAAAQNPRSNRWFRPRTWARRALGILHMRTSS